MILDHELIFDDGVSAVTAATPGRVGGSVAYCDRGAQQTTPWKGPNPGAIAAGEQLDGYAVVTEAFNNATAVEVAIVTATATDMTTGQTKLVARSIPLAQLTIGNLIPLGKVSCGVGGRYLGAYITPSGTAPTTGKIKVGATSCVPQNVPLQNY